MKKLAVRAVFCLVVTLSAWSVGLLADRASLNDEVIRMHVVANSDGEEDQSIKLQVRDAVLGSLQQDLQNITDLKAAKAYLQENIPKITDVVNSTLEKAGFDGHAVVTLCKETFDTRYYDTFRLPAGVYESLRITIGAGEGKNWWCVVFPGFCIPETPDGFEEAATAAGFSEALCDSLTVDKDYEIRFYLLDAIGKVENFFFKG